MSKKVVYRSKYLANGGSMQEGVEIFEAYWRLRMDSAHRRMEAALDLISHKPSRGALAENLVRELIDSFLPKRWASGTGFVIGAEKSSSLQLDVLLFDQTNYAPYYRDEHLVLLPAGTGPAAVEVKSILTKDSIFEAFENIASLKRIDGSAKGSIFAFRGVEPQTLASHLRAFIDDAKANGTFNPRTLPDMICALESRVVVLHTPSAGHQMTGYSAIDPVVQFLLMQVLNDLKVASLYKLLPKPRSDAEPLFMV
jgi:hypothetical protein